MFSLIIPVYNEESAAADTITRAEDALKKIGAPFEILVINDGSTDSTAKNIYALASESIHILHHSENTGYSASIKTGIRKSTGELVAITDADGTYPVEELPSMLAHLKASQTDMIVGARTKKAVHIPLIRRPAKAFIALLATILVGKKIPDLNSGLRIFTRELAEEFWHLYPQRFSFTMTITLAALTNDYRVEYYPIEYGKRVGSSTLSSGFNGVKNFANFIGLIVRITTYFRPLRFFTIPSVLLFFGGLGLMIFTIITQKNISDAGLLLFVTGLQIGLFGLLADMVVRNRRRG
jgi:polyisoprenyl-phosphate glycosyltransferase